MLSKTLFSISLILALSLGLLAGRSTVPASRSAVPMAGTSQSALAISGCSVFPANNIWNTRVDNLPLNAHSDQWVNSIGRDTGFHMDFGSGTWDGGPIGIPYNLAGAATLRYAVDF
jgi:hypothetical protein